MEMDLENLNLDKIKEKTQKYSRVYAKINLDAVMHNLEAMRALLKPGTQMLAVIKTDGYGHGAAEIAAETEGLDYLFGFAVATAEEALVLRRHGIKKPVLVLGYVFPEHYEMLAEYGIRPSVFTYEMAKELSNAASFAFHDLKVHIKIDTGMGRIGLPVSRESAKIIARIAALPHIIIEGMFTHFATADERDKAPAMRQLALFTDMIRMTEQEGVSIPYRHCSNSAGIVDIPEANLDIVRAGITLYGLWPSDEVHKERIALQPAMELISHVSFVKDLPAGGSVSYGATYTAKEPRRIATVPVGYGDGYPRSLSNRGCVLIHGQRAPVCGRVCMDQFMVDVTDIADVRTGDRVTLAGADGEERITLEELGEISGRFNYEFACCIGKRVPRVFFRNGERISARDSFGE